MLTSYKHKLAFIHIPKTGGCSITAALEEIWDWRQGPIPPPPPHGQREGNWAHRFHQTGNQHDEVDAPEGYTVAAFVRNPWHRAQSLWTYSARPNEGFAEWLKNVDAGRTPVGHPYVDRQQVSWLRRQVNWWGRYEALNADFQRLMKHIGHPDVPLPHRNRDPRILERTEMMRPEDAAMVERIWPNDCEELGYGCP